LPPWTKRTLDARGVFRGILIGMPDLERTHRTSVAAADDEASLFAESFSLAVTLDVPAGAFRFEWARLDTGEVIAKGRLLPPEIGLLWGQVLNWILEGGSKAHWDGCNAWAASTRALTRRIRKLFPVAEGTLRLGLLTDADLGMAQAGRRLPIKPPPGLDSWKWLEHEIHQFAQLTQSSFTPDGNPTVTGRTVLHLLACALLEIPPSLPGMAGAGGKEPALFDLRVTFNQVKCFAEFVWTGPGSKRTAAIGKVRCTGPDQLTWELEIDGRREPAVSSHHRNSIRAAMERWLKQFPANRPTFCVFWIRSQPGTDELVCEQEPPFSPDEAVYRWVEDNLVEMAEALRFQFSPLGRILDEIEPALPAEIERYRQRELRKQQKWEEEESRRKQLLARQAEERRQRELRQAELRKEAEARKAAEAKANVKSRISNLKLPAERPSLPPLPVRFEMPPLSFQETAFPLADLRGFFLRERAALWWVSNQSDDLLCLPHCRIQRLEYQLRTALRVLGPLRGRALLSDEVGLGKTIEAGLVIKELLTRGMVKRFLVLTVPSLVDQWEEELSDKFGLAAVTTNHAAARNDPQNFWRQNTGIVASLHTLKQRAQLEIARQVQWDILVVDEAHYLRNRESQAWQAVNALPRQFLLLLTATPVQNSLEELYNLVTLLQPGQLPTPKEFRARFLDPKRPRQPREPEELRRLVGQVMIRNTRANAGLNLPPRRAETVLFEPEEAERAFWQHWDGELRGHLARLSASQSSLWGRLLLQTAGSSPAAWRKALEKFPDAEAARAWREQSPLEISWRRKCELIPPLTRVEGGAVIFTQFLETQAALADFLRGAGVDTFVINGATPAPERQPITEEFGRRGGALLLTHSGTEGRNLQCSHQLVNFDLPWNPMEIEQRIGRLHRLGQQHPVRIYNFVQAGTLQEHLLQLLQEKLNLFELVVGETGLVLGERFGSDEFAEEIFRRWRESEGRVAEALAGLGDELAAARDAYGEVKQLDETLFAKDYESL
jgi:SNF2 family DNA or RNA helicase